MALRQTYGYDPAALTTSPSSQPLANGVVFCRIKRCFTGSRLVSLPFSDHCEPLVGAGEDPGEFVNLAASDRWRYVELRPLQAAPSVSLIKAAFERARCFGFIDWTFLLVQRNRCDPYTGATFAASPRAYRRATWIGWRPRTRIRSTSRGRRARRFALTLMAQGETMDVVEHSLHTGGFHPALADEAVRWARAQATDDDAATDTENSLPAIVPRQSDARRGGMPSEEASRPAAGFASRSTSDGRGQALNGKRAS